MVVIKAVADIKCTESSLALTTFIAGVRRIVHAESNRKRVAGAVAELLEPYLQVEDLLTQDQVQPDAKNIDSMCYASKPTAASRSRRWYGCRARKRRFT